MMQSILSFITSSLFQSDSLSLILNHVVQVYCFNFGVLHLLTLVLTSTNFIYADFLLRNKPAPMVSFVMFWLMKLWLVYDDWMFYVNFLLAIYIAIYFYDGTCNLTNYANTTNTTRKGAVLVVLNVFLMGLLLYLRKHNKTLS